MRGSNSIEPGEKIIDSREVTERIEYLESSLDSQTCPECEEEITLDGEEESGHKDNCDYSFEGDGWGLDYDEMEELKNLKALQKEAQDYSSDWIYGETLISDSYFEEYTQDLCVEIGYCTSEQLNQWPFTCIDWGDAAKELQQDYISVEFGSETYWIRSS